MKRWSLIVLAVIWLGTGLFLTCVDSLASSHHGGGHGAGEVHAAETEAHH